MQPSDYLTILNILVAFLGVAFVVLTIIEWWKLRALRKDMQNLEKRTIDRLHQSLKAAHRIIASYQITDPQSRIALLESALSLDPDAYNGFNSLGYAWMELDKTGKATDAFAQAVSHHPHDKEGYCDLAYAYQVAGEEDLCVKYLRKAIRIDPSVREDIASDSRLAPQLIDQIFK